MGTCTTPHNTWKSNINGLGLFTGQVGYAWNAALLYVKGGAAVASQRFDIFNTLTGIGLGQAERTRWGGVALSTVSPRIGPPASNTLSLQGERQPYVLDAEPRNRPLHRQHQVGCQHDHWPHQLQIWRLWLW